MLEARRSGDRPRPRQRPLVAQVGHELVVGVRLGGELDGDGRERGDIRDHPRLGAVGEICVREQEDRRPVLERDPRRLERRVEAVAGSGGGDDRHRRLGVPAVERQQEIGLLRLRGHARRGPGPLDVEDHERELERDGESDRLALQHHPRPARSRHAQRAAERRADGGPDRGDLVLGLEGADAEVLVPREVVEDVGGRRDRVRAQEERQLRLHARRDQPEGERLVARDVPVGAGRELRGRDLVLRREALARLAERIAGLERPRVRLDDLRPLRELLVDEGQRALGGARVQPRHQPEREHVLRALRLALRDLDLLQLLERERGERNLMQVVVVERAVLERVRRVARLLEVAVGERVGVDDQRAPGREVIEIRAQRGWVHRDEDVRRVARCEDVVVREVDLEARDAGQRARRGPDLGREIGQSREVVAEERRLAREAPAGQLHAVAGVTGEADDHLLELLDGLGHSSRTGIAALRPIRSLA